MLLAEP